MTNQTVTPISIGAPFNPRPMSDRVRLATTVVCLQIDRLQRVVARLAVQGFAPLAFSVDAVDGMQVEIEEPRDELLDGRQVAGRFDGRSAAVVWFVDEGVRVFWYPAREAA